MSSTGPEARIPSEASPFDARELFGRGVDIFVGHSNLRENIRFRFLNIDRYEIGAIIFPNGPIYQVFVRPKSQIAEKKRPIYELFLSYRSLDPDTRKVFRDTRYTPFQLTELVQQEIGLGISGGIGDDKSTLKPSEPIDVFEAVLKQPVDEETTERTQKDALPEIEDVIDEQIRQAFELMYGSGAETEPSEKFVNKFMERLRFERMVENSGFYDADDDVAILQMATALYALSKTNDSSDASKASSEKLIGKALSSLFPASV